jgi:flagellar biosynthetic protein FlhB
MTEDQSQKTEQPTQRRLEKARKEGSVFNSKEVNAFLALLTLSLLIFFLGQFFTKNLIDKLQIYISKSNDLIAQNLTNKILLDIAPFILLPALIMMIVNIAAILFQQGILYAPEVIMPKLNRISPIAGFKRIFSLNSLFELIKGIIKIIVLGFIMYYAIKGDITRLSQSYNLSILDGISLIMASLFKLLVAASSFLFFLAILDYLYQRYSYYERMKMTKKEVKDENKEQEGSPEIKSKLRSMRIKMSKARVMAALPKADLLITNPTHFAVALEYKDEKIDAPVVIAKGQDNLALKMREKAKELKIPIVENPPLARLLYKEVEIGKTIRPKHYKAVAEVIAYLMKLQSKIQK